MFPNCLPSCILVYASHAFSKGYVRSITGRSLYFSIKASISWNSSQLPIEVPNTLIWGKNKERTGKRRSSPELAPKLTIRPFGFIWRRKYSEKRAGPMLSRTTSAFFPATVHPNCCNCQLRNQHLIAVPFSFLLTAGGHAYRCSNRFSHEQNVGCNTAADAGYQ